jgi:hypothetical protein
MDNNEKQQEQPCCPDNQNTPSSPAPCCGPQPDTGNSKRKWIKRSIFMLIVLAALAVASHSLFFSRDSDNAQCTVKEEAKKPCCPKK